MSTSAVPFVIMLSLCLALPKPVRPYAFGGFLCLVDAVIVPNPIVSVSWVAFFTIIMVYFRPSLSSFRKQVNTVFGLILASLILYDIFAIYLVVEIFQGKFMVMPSSSHFMIQLADYVALVPSHLNQLIYLVIGVVAAIMIAASSEPSKPQIVLSIFDKLMVGFAFFASTIAMWELLSHATGLWFPGELFHNELRPVAWKQGIAGVPRVSGPFSEPSGLAGYLGPALCFLAARRIDGHPAVLRQVAIFFGMAALLVSTSTTAYIALPAVVLSLICSAILRPYQVRNLNALAKKEADALVKTLLFAGLGVFSGISFALYAINRYNVAGVIQQALLYKDRSGSFEERMYANRLAVDAFLKTGGLGIGLGGHVASSMYLTIAACLGFWGIFAFSWFTIAGLAAPFRRRPPASVSATEALVEGRLSIAAMFFGELIASGASGGNVSDPFLWMSFGLLMALEASARSLSGRQTARGGWRVVATRPFAVTHRVQLKGRP